MKWLAQKSWAEITREERQFCADLYSAIKDDPGKFVNFLNSACWDSGRDCSHRLNSDADWEVGIEVALYRDCNHHSETLSFDDCAGDDGKQSDTKKVGENKTENTKASAYRKFDLALFSDTQLVVIEAKAQRGFTGAELCTYLGDSYILSRNLANKDVETFFVALCSSHYINSSRRKSNLNSVFDVVVPWSSLVDRYSNSSFQRADDVYRK